MKKLSVKQRKRQAQQAQQKVHTSSPPGPPAPTERLCWRIAKKIVKLFAPVLATPVRKILAFLGGVVVLAALYEYYVDTVPFAHPKAEGLHPLQEFPFVVSNNSKFFDTVVESFDCKVEKFVTQSSSPVHGKLELKWTGRGAASWGTTKDGNFVISADFPGSISSDKDIKIKAQSSKDFLCNALQFGGVLLYEKNPDGHLEADGAPGPQIPVVPISLNVVLTVHYHTVTPFISVGLTKSDTFEILSKNNQFYWSDFLPAQ